MPPKFLRNRTTPIPAPAHPEVEDYRSNGATNPSFFKVCRTVSGLAFRKNRRRNTWEIRLLPAAGPPRFSSTAWRFTTAGTFGAPGIPALRKLRLSGLAQSLEVRLQEAGANRLSHAEFLELILQDELHVRTDRLLQRRIKAARFRDLKTLDGFDFSFNPSTNRKQICELATGRFIRQARDVLMVDPPGVGKSHLAEALGYPRGAWTHPGQDDNYAVRLRGVLTAPETGYYDFYVSSDDGSVLLLGEDDRAQSRRRIAEVPLHSQAGDYDCYEQQRSAPIHLTQGEAYYFEVFQKDGTFDDHLSVAWHQML